MKPLKLNFELRIETHVVPDETGALAISRLDAERKGLNSLANRIIGINPTFEVQSSSDALRLKTLKEIAKS